MLRALMLLSLAMLAPTLQGCGGSGCARVCKKLAACKALSTDVDTCTRDCEKPTLGRTCSNEDAIAGCIENASCDDLTKESARLHCPVCQ